MSDTKGTSVPAIERALTVLEFLAHSKSGFSPSEISRKFGLPKSSTYLIAGTLEPLGFLQKNSHGGRYCFRLRLIKLGPSALPRPKSCHWLDTSVCRVYRSPILLRLPFGGTNEWQAALDQSKTIAATFKCPVGVWGYFP